MSAAPAAGAAPLRLLLVDDEPLARLRLRQLLAQPGMPPHQVVGEAGDAQALRALLQQQPAADAPAPAGPAAASAAPPGCDALLLDIALPGLSGLAIADALRSGGAPAPAVIFVTAHAEHALKAWELDAADYLTKPVRAERLREALQRLQRRPPAAAALPPGRPGGAAAAGAVLLVPDRGRLLRIPHAELLYCKAEHKYVTVVTEAGQWLLDESLNELEARLGPGFVRVHRNALVAVAAVRALALQRSPAGEAPAAGAWPGEGWVVCLRDGQRLAVSRRQLAAVREALGAAA